MGDLTTISVAPSNVGQSQAWDGDEGEYWAAHARQFDEAVAAYHEALMEAGRIGADDSVLDIGCGTGQTTRDAARLAASGRALGVDLSSQMLTVARRLAEQEALTNVEFLHADAQVHPFPDGSYDVALSRTGAMFFGDLVAAFRNLRRALRPGGRLALVAWQPISENEWFREIGAAMAAGRDLPTPPPDAPGPFSLSEPERVTRLLVDAGFGDPAFRDLHAPMYFGPTATQAYGLVAGLTGWMLEGLDDPGRRRALDDLYATMAEHETPSGVELGSAMWLVTSRRI